MLHLHLELLWVPVWGIGSGDEEELEREGPRECRTGQGGGTALPVEPEDDAHHLRLAFPCKTVFLGLRVLLANSYHDNTVSSELLITSVCSS